MEDGLGCNTLSGKWENVVVMTQIGCGVAVTWDGLCLAESSPVNTRPFRFATCTLAQGKTTDTQLKTTKTNTYMSLNNVCLAIIDLKPHLYNVLFFIINQRFLLSAGHIVLSNSSACYFIS